MPDKPLEEVGKALNDFADIFEGPNLGLATTEQLFREIIARFTIPHFRDETSALKVNCALVLSEMLGSLSVFDKEYRTISERGANA